MRIKIKHSILLFITVFNIVFPISLIANEIQDFNNKSPFSDEVYSIIKSQIDKKIIEKNSATFSEEDLESDEMSILKNISDGLRKDFKSEVYKIETDLSIMLAFLDIDVEKYFKPIKDGVFLDFKRNNLNIFVQKTNGSYKSRTLIFPYKKNGIATSFLKVNDSGGLFFFVPNFGKENIQSVVMCPRALERGKDSSLYLRDNNWMLTDVLGITYSKSSIVINDLTDAKISASVNYSKDCHLKSVYNENVGKLTSVESEYESSRQGAFEKFISKPFKFPLLFSLLSQVSYQKDDVIQTAHKRVVYEVKDFELTQDFKFKQNLTLKKGKCFMVISGHHALAQLED